MKRSLLINTNSIQYFLYYCIFFLLLFTSNDEEINIPHLPISVGIVFPLSLAILFICLLLNMLFKKSKGWNVLDILIIFFCLLRVILFTTGYFLHQFSSLNFSRYLSVFLWPILYMLTLFQDNSIENKKKNLKLIKVVIFIISIQTIVSAIEVYKSGININYAKNFIRIPLAPSNTITCYLLLLIPFIYFIDKGKSRIAILLLELIAILLTRSMSGILTLFLFGILAYLADKSSKKTLKFLIAMLLFGIIIIIIMKLDPSFFQRYVNRLQLLFSSDSMSRADSLNGRADIYSQAFNLIKWNFPFGLGVSYSIWLGGQLAHNWILESLLQEGFLNLLLVIVIFSLLFRRISVNKNSWSKAGVISLMLVLFQALIEPSITAFPFDLFMWLFLGNATRFSDKVIMKNNE